jgi:hypothetical protein
MRESYMMERETEDIDVFLLGATNSLLFFNRGGGGRKFFRVSEVRIEVLCPFRWHSEFLRAQDIWRMSAFWGTEYFFPRQIIWEDGCYVLSEEEGFGMVRKEGEGVVEICREGADEWVAMMIKHMNYPINYLENVREEEEEEEGEEEGQCFARDLVEFLEYLPERGVRVSMSQYEALRSRRDWFEKFNRYAKFMELPKYKNKDDN